MEFYAGSPLFVEQHYAIGALCLSDHQPRAFSAQEELMLNELAALVSQAISRHWRCLAEAGGAQYWQAMQQVAVEDICLLRALIGHLRARHAESILHVVRRRLANLKALVNGSSALLPAATSLV